MASSRTITLLTSQMKESLPDFRLARRRLICALPQLHCGKTAQTEVVSTFHTLLRFCRPLL
jgi:hypothetical protein